MRFAHRARADLAAILLTTLAFALSLPLAAQQPLSRGHVYLESSFDSLAGWPAGAKLGAGALLIEQTKPNASAVVSRTLPVEQMRGCLVFLSARVRADISQPPESWNGVKLMAIIESPSGKSWPQAKFESLSFDWQRAGTTLRIPPDATNVTLVLGLENVTGKAWFDDIRVTLGRGPVANAAAPRPRGAEDKVYTGHPEPRLRGAMISPNIDEDGLRTLGHTWRANLIRWQLIHTPRRGQSLSLDDYDAWLDAELDRLDRALPLCRTFGLRVAIDLHSPPGGKPVFAGGYAGADAGLFSDPAAQDKFVAVWRRIAQRYRASGVVWGYDLANEPVDDHTAEGCEDWQGLAQRTARAVRDIDPDHAIIVQPPRWGSASGFIGFYPIDVPGVVYSFHMYEPHPFTHQGVHDQKHVGLTYPGPVLGKQWDKAALEQAMRPAVEFQQRYVVHLYVGEFSAIRWAPDGSAHRYIRDLIEIFESHAWDWSYHAFREWQGWSPEHGDDRNDTARAKSPTPREQLLRHWFERNAKEPVRP